MCRVIAWPMQVRSTSGATTHTSSVFERASRSACNPSDCTPSSFDRRISKKNHQMIKIGATGFEQAATSTPYWCASQTALRPDFLVYYKTFLLIPQARTPEKKEGIVAARPLTFPEGDHNRFMWKKRSGFVTIFGQRSHRLGVQDAGLSRRKHEFESRWDHFYLLDTVPLTF